MESSLMKVRDERVERLRAVYRHPHVRAVVDVLGTMPEFTKAVSISDLKKRIPGLTRKEIIAAVKKATCATMGSFKVGRRGYDSRIEHWVSVHLIYEAAIGKAKEPPPAIKPKLISHTFHLRPGLDVTFALPEDLSKDEAVRLGNLLTVIPF